MSFLVVVQSLSRVWLCNFMDCSTPGFLILYHLPEFAQVHVHQINNAIQPSYPLSLTSSPALSVSQHQGYFFPVSQLFASGGQSIGASASVILMSIQGWFPLGLTGLICLKSKALSRFFSSTTVRKHQFSCTLPSIWSSSHICTWLLGKTMPWLYEHLLAKYVFAF